MSATMKTCRKCNQDKPPTEFYADIRAKDGLYSSCKSCSRSVRKANNWSRVEGLCHSCGRIPLSGYLRCADCLVKKREKQRKYLGCKRRNQNSVSYQAERQGAAGGAWWRWKPDEKVAKE